MKKAKTITTTALFVAVIAICSQIVIPLGAIPFSMGVFGVVLAGALLPPVQAGACIAAYLFLGIVGIPVFAGFNGGVSALLGPTGGFILGYIFLIFTCSTARKWALWQRFFAAAVGLALLYTCGSLWFVYSTGADFAAALYACVVPFILPDAAKLALALPIAAVIKKRLKLEGKI